MSCKFPKRLIKFWTIVKLKLSLLGVVLREKGLLRKLRRLKKDIAKVLEN